GGLRISVASGTNPAGVLNANIAYDGNCQGAIATGVASQSMQLSIPKAKLWSPNAPHLYDLRLIVRRDNRVVDRANSYFGMRKMGLERDGQGNLRMMLNHRPLFQLGPLDQV